MVAVVFLGGNLAKKRQVAASDGTLATDNAMFTGLLIGVILIISMIAIMSLTSDKKKKGRGSK